MVRLRAKCETEYQKNRCDPSSRMEAAAEFCEERDKCRSAESVGFGKALIAYVIDHYRFLSQSLSIRDCLLIFVLASALGVYYRFRGPNEG